MPPSHVQASLTLRNARKTVATRENYKVLLLPEINMGDRKSRIRIFKYQTFPFPPKITWAPYQFEFEFELRKF